jgi:hypothetical protein
MQTTILATALELARLHGVRFAAAYLCDQGIAVEVAVEVLARKHEDIRYSARNIESSPTCS